MIIWKLLLSSINSQKIRKFCVWEVMIAIVFNPKQQKPIPHSLSSMLNAFFYQNNPFFLTQISKRSTPTDLHHPDLHLAQFFCLESLKIFSAYAKTSLGLKMEKFLQTISSWKVAAIPFILRWGRFIWGKSIQVLQNDTISISWLFSFRVIQLTVPSILLH